MKHISRFRTSSPRQPLGYLSKLLDKDSSPTGVLSLVDQPMTSLFSHVGATPLRYRDPAKHKVDDGRYRLIHVGTESSNTDFNSLSHPEVPSFISEPDQLTQYLPEIRRSTSSAAKDGFQLAQDLSFGRLNERIRGLSTPWNKESEGDQKVVEHTHHAVNPSHSAKRHRVRIQNKSGLLQISNGSMTLEVRLDPFRWSIKNSIGKSTAREQSGGLFYTRRNDEDDSTATYGIREVVEYHRLRDGIELEVLTEEGLKASVTLRFSSNQTLGVTFLPPNPDSVIDMGDRLLSPGSEAIYGLTERLQDSSLLSETPPFSFDPRAPEIPVQDVLPGFPQGSEVIEPFSGLLIPWGAEVGSLNRRGEMVEMKVYPTIALYTPFYQSSRDYGLHVEGTTFGQFDIAQSNPSELKFNFEAGSDPGLNFNVFSAPQPTTILDEYTQQTGRPFVPPDWAFSNWRWRDELGDKLTTPDINGDGIPDAEYDLDDNGIIEEDEKGLLVNEKFAEDLMRFDEIGIPPGVYLFDRPVLLDTPTPVQDLPTTLAPTYGFERWAWNEKQLGNIEAIFASLKKRGYHTVIWSSTFQCGIDEGDNGHDAQNLGYLAPGSLGPTTCSDFGPNYVLDVTNPDARTWWQGRIADFVEQWGIQGIKLDRGEELIPSEITDIWFDGRTGREVRNDYPNLQAQVHHDALESVYPDQDFLVISRAGYSDTHPYSIFWGGDTPGSTLFGLGPGTDLGLRSAIISQQRAAYMGMPIWGSDTGGYYEFKDREVFARWIEFSAFSGIMEIGGQGNHAPWDMPTEPTFDAEMIGIYKRYTELRETLLPYIVESAQEAEKGVPIVRPMAIAYPNVPDVHDRWDQYLFGPDLLVAPVWEIGERAREVYLPSGQWRNYWNPSEVFQGRQTINVDVPLDTIPVFVRDGADVPHPELGTTAIASGPNPREIATPPRFDLEAIESSLTELHQNSFFNSLTGSLSSKLSHLIDSQAFEQVFGTRKADLLISDLDGPFDGFQDVVRTGAGPDEVDAILAATQGAQVGQNVILTGHGDDYVFVGYQDQVLAGAGNDAIDATDSLGGNRGFGNRGKDSFYLGQQDWFVGGQGQDRFFVGAGGGNILSGGPGADEFWIANGVIPNGVNIITDFKANRRDKIFIAGASSLGINHLGDLSQQVIPGVGLLLSSLDDPLALLKGVKNPLGRSNLILESEIV